MRKDKTAGKGILIYSLVFVLCVCLISLSSAQQIERTESSDTICNEGVCTKTIYSGIRNVFEEGQWKKVEEARSLKDKGFIVGILEDDPEFPIEVVDFNYTSIEVKLNPRGIKVFNQNIPVRVWEEDEELESNYQTDILEGLKIGRDLAQSYKERMKKVTEENIGFNLLNQEEQKTYNFPFGSILEFGFNSTTIILNQANTEFLEDTYLENGDTTENNAEPLKLDLIPFQTIVLKFRLTDIPLNSVILASNLSLHTLTSGGQLDNSSWYVAENQTWREENIWNDTHRKTLQINSTILDMKTLPNSMGTRHSFNITEGLRWIYGKGYGNVTIFGNASGSGVWWAGYKEDSTSRRPILYVTYLINNFNPNVTSLTEAPPDPAEYNPNTVYVFNSTVVDEATLDTVLLNFNGTNFTTLQDGNIFTKTFTGLGIGTHSYTWIANDTEGGLNNTESGTYTVQDTTVPMVNLVSPTNSTFTSVQTSLTYTFSDLLTQGCWYSTDEGSTNNTISCGTNVTGLDSGQGSSTWIINTNDTSGNYASDRVTFFVDSILPFVNFTSKTSINNTIYTSNTIFVNVTVTETNEDTIKFDLYNSGGLVNSSSHTDGTRSINWTVSDGIYIYNVTVNDTLGQINNTETRTITADSTPPFFTTIPNNDSILYENNWTGADFDADDSLVGFSAFAVNDTRFSINSSGFLNVTNNVITVGTHKMLITITDTLGNSNTTTYQLQVNQSVGEVALFIDHTRAGIETNELNANDTQLNATLLNGNGFIWIHINHSLVNNGTSPLFNITNFTLGTVRVNATYGGNENYSGDSESWLVIITAVSSSTSTSLQESCFGTFNSFDVGVSFIGVIVLIFVVVIVLGFVIFSNGSPDASAISDLDGLTPMIVIIVSVSVIAAVGYLIVTNLCNII